MTDTDSLGERADHQAQGMMAEEKLRLLVRWLLHCHKKARQRRQLGVLEPRLQDDIGVTRSEVLEEIEKPFWQ